MTASRKSAVQPNVFVIMPFDDEFNSVYEQFIKPTFEEQGFVVLRADDILNQQHILKDIIDQIEKGDLIVADLTSTNPNVFYELGLAHAFRKRVILLTQSIEEVPFDLQGYRLVVYSTHFAEIEKAKSQLARLAAGALQGDVEFGNPVTHFMPIEQEPNPPAVVDRSDAEGDPDDGGFLDHVIGINEFYESVTAIMQNVSRDLGSMTSSVESANRNFDRIKANQSSSSPTAMRSVCRHLAKQIANFTDRLKAANTEYASRLYESEDSLEIVLSFTLEHNENRDPQVLGQLSSLDQLRSQAIECRDSLLYMAQSMDELPRIERHLNREVTRGSQEVRTMASNIGRTVASISRALHGHLGE